MGHAHAHPPQITAQPRNLAGPLWRRARWHDQQARRQPADVDQWGWSCGFYPGLEPGEHQSGSARTFEAARADFEAAWARLLPNLSAEDFTAYRRNRAFHEWKSMMWDCGSRMPTQELTGRSRCYCGAPIDLKTTEAHI
jgi:hypothetical protein